VAGGPRAILRLEGALLFVAALVAYRHAGGGLGALAAAFLLPDVAFVAYLAGPRFGAAAYNATHALLGPTLLGALAALLPATSRSGTVWLSALVWAAHVGFDRMLGYGLKYASAFGDTHLGRVGITARPAPAG